MLSKLLNSISPTPKTPKPSATMSGFVSADYSSNPVDIPDTFLTTPPSQPVTSTPVPWKDSPVPEYAKCKAWILDNVLSLEECSQLIAYAEASARVEKPDDSPWRPALISVAPGLETRAPGYRNSDRIIWDNQLLVDRLWDRCAQVEGLQELVATAPCTRPDYRRDRKGTWKFERLNERMRFLKYTPGMFFRGE